MKVEQDKFATEKQYKNRKALLSFVKSIGYIIGGFCVLVFGVTIIGVLIGLTCKLFMLGYSLSF